MSTVKIIASAAIVLGSLIAGLFLIGEQSLNQKMDEKKNGPAAEHNTKAALSLQPLSEPVPNPQTDPTTTQPPQTTAVPEEIPLDQTNDTRRLTQLIVRQMMSQNPNTLLGKNGSGPGVDPEALTAQFVQEFAVTDYQPFVPAVKLSDIKIVPTSESAYQTYFSILRESAAKNTSSLNAASFSPDDLQRIESSLNRSFQTLITAPTPAKLAEFHRRSLELVGAQKNIFAALIKIGEDPVKAFAAYRALPLVFREVAVLRAEIAGFINREKIVL